MTGAQQAAIESDGFTLTVVARVIQNVAPTWSAGSEIVVAGSGGAGFGGIGLGIDANGDTVVVLPYTVNLGPGG